LLDFRLTEEQELVFADLEEIITTSVRMVCVQADVHGCFLTHPQDQVVRMECNPYPILLWTVRRWQTLRVCDIMR